MEIALGVFILISIVGVSILIRLFINAPVGYEDESGFHLGEK